MSAGRIYFYSQVADNIDVLKVTCHEEAGWSTPKVIESLDDLEWNDGPFFISAAFSELGGQDIYYVDYSENSYQTPRPVDAPINTQCDEYFQCFSNTFGYMILYRFDEIKENRGLFISQRSKQGWEIPRNLSKIINLPSGFRANFSPNEEFLFILNRKDGLYWIRSDCLKDL